MRLVALVALSISAVLLTAWTNGGAGSSPPQCSAADTRRNDTLLSPSRAVPFYIRFCGNARAVLQVDTKIYALSGGHCLRPESAGWRGLGGLAIGLLSNPPKAPPRGVIFRWNPPLATAGEVEIDDSEVELGGSRIAVSGTVVVAKKLKGGTFTLYGHDASGPTGPRVTGSWSCG